MSHNSSPNHYDDWDIDDIVIDSLINNDSYKRMQEICIQYEQEAITPKNKRKYYRREREEGHKRLMEDYFCSDPVYSDALFHRRFRMTKSLFLRIVNALENRNEYFRLRHDATGRQRLSPLQKCTAAIRMLAYGVAADALDEYLHIGESTAMECLLNFVRGVIEEFETKYLREPNEADVRRLLQVGEARGFPGMLGSIDCMHWEWKNCPTAWHGQFCRGDYSKPTIMLEVVASQDTWFWHAFFGTPGSCNDLNVLNRSPVFNNILEGRAPQIN